MLQDSDDEDPILLALADAAAAAANALAEADTEEEAESADHSVASVWSDSASDNTTRYPPLIIHIPRAVLLAANGAASAPPPLSPFTAFLQTAPTVQSTAPLTPLLPTGQYAAPIVISDEDEDEADDEGDDTDEAINDENADPTVVFARSRRYSMTAVHGSDTEHETESDVEMSQ